MSIIGKTNIIFHRDDIRPSEIMEEFIESGGLIITAPQEESPMMQMLTIDSLKDFNTGKSIKPGNIKLNIRHLLESMPEITTSIVEIATDIPILKVCAALNIWKIIRDIISVEITKEQAIAIIALWENCNHQHRITLEDGFDCFKTLYTNIEKSECTWEQYLKIINDLEKIDSIELDENEIWLREWVSKRYTK